MKRLRLWLWRRLLERGCLIVTMRENKWGCIFNLRDQKRHLDIFTCTAHQFGSNEWIIV